MNARRNTPAFPKAMPAPSDSPVLIDEGLMSEAVAMSRRSPRGRIILPLHNSDQATLHRMLNAIQPGSYVQPHRHSNPPKAESIVVLQGGIHFIIFDDRGKIVRNFALAAGSARFGVDLDSDIYHTFFATSADTVLFEVKPGPYLPASDKDFAAWAPEENSDSASSYLENLYRLLQIKTPC